MSNYTPLTVLFDANVLYPQSLRDLLLQIAYTDLIKAKWTIDIHKEWIHNLHRNKPHIPIADLQKVRMLMDRTVPDCLVTGYKPFINSLQLPDPNDRHVLAAAMVGRADIILTMNLKDFPKPKLQPLGIEAIHPDVLIAYLLDLHPVTICDCVKQQRANLTKPRTVEHHLDILEKNLRRQIGDQFSPSQTVHRLKQNLDLL